MMADILEMLHGKPPVRTRDEDFTALFEAGQAQQLTRSEIECAIHDIVRGVPR
jgi:hypothetical protein